MLSFKQMLGLEKESEIILDGVINPEALAIEVNQLIFSSLPDRLDIQKLIGGINLLKIQKKSENHSAKYPDLSLIYSKKYDICR